MHKLYLFLVFLVVLILSGTGLYFHYISPAFVEKPYIERPAEVKTESIEMSGIDDSHVQYVANEMGSYMLHEDPITKEPAVMEMRTGEDIFTVTVIDNYPQVYKGEAVNPDLRITAQEEIIIKLLQSEDFKGSIIEYVGDGRIQIEILTDEKTLAMKGYKAVYDSMT